MVFFSWSIISKARIPAPKTELSAPLHTAPSPQASRILNWGRLLPKLPPVTRIRREKTTPPRCHIPSCGCWLLPMPPGPHDEHPVGLRLGKLWGSGSEVSSVIPSLLAHWLLREKPRWQLGSFRWWVIAPSYKSIQTTSFWYTTTSWFKMQTFCSSLPEGWNMEFTQTSFAEVFIVNH